MIKSNFHLIKWYLDLTDEHGCSMIFYSAKLRWNGFTSYYASWINNHPKTGTKVRSHFRNVQLPEQNNNEISWADDRFEVSGIWTAVSSQIQDRIFDSETGYLDWNCFQPASSVKLKVKGELINGKGYAEQLILTAPPWHIPMTDLRWGRFHAPEVILVWIELRNKQKQQWLWLNGEKIKDCRIDDHCISSEVSGFVLHLDRAVVLESENKIYQVTQKLLSFLPGFNKIMPYNFLMADNYKWRSSGAFQNNEGSLNQGIAIHEWVDFNSKT